MYTRVGARKELSLVLRLSSKKMESSAGVYVLLVIYFVLIMGPSLLLPTIGK